MEKRIITYSLLAHLNNTGTLSDSYEKIFVPLIKRAVSKMCSDGKNRGKSILEIKDIVDALYGLDIPIPLLKILLNKIELEINSDTQEHLKFYSDGSFIINEYAFDEFEEEFQKKETEIQELEKMFEAFNKESGNSDSSSIFVFIEQNKKSLGKYIGKKYPQDYQDLTTEARFVDFIKKIPPIYKSLQTIYLGSIISTYLEYTPQQIDKKTELLLDTNFIVSLLDLNTLESTHSCTKLVELAKRLGYTLTVLDITIQETEGLLANRIDNFNNTFLSRLIDPEDIFNACQRRDLSKTDLEKIRANIEVSLQKMGIAIISNTEKYRNRAKFSVEYEKLKNVRNTGFAALHDATCLDYVKQKRGNKQITDFNKVNCWFVNNSSTKQSVFVHNGDQPYAIKGEDLLNMLWLTAPSIKASINLDEFTDIGLTRLISTTINDSLPQASIIRELDNNIAKYAKDNISDEDVVRISTSIAQKTIKDIEGLNKTAKSNDKEFITRLQEIANEQKQKEQQLKSVLDQLVKTFKSKTKDAENIINEYQGLKQENFTYKLKEWQTENEIRKIRQKDFIRKAKFKWRLVPFLLILICPILLFIICLSIYKYKGYNLIATTDYISYIKDNIFVTIPISIAGLIYSGIFIKRYSDTWNQSAINAFVSTLEFPDDIKDLPKPVNLE